jgi:uncharacterized UBP type Zn finger protein
LYRTPSFKESLSKKDGIYFMKRLLDELETIIDYDNLFISEVINRYCCSKCKAEESFKNTRKDYLSVKLKNDSIGEAIKKSLMLMVEMDKTCKKCSQKSKTKILSSFKKLPKIMIIKNEDEPRSSRIKIPTIMDFKSFVDQNFTINSTLYNLTSIVDTDSKT